MKKIIRTIVVAGIMISINCFPGIAETENNERCISLDKCIPLEDIAYYYIDEYDYPCFALKDVGFQFDDSSNRSYADIIETLENKTSEYRNNIVDMRNVIDFDVTENGLMLYLEDGTGYYWER